MAQWSDFYPEFRPYEFDQRTPDGKGTGEKNMSLDFVAKLHRMRKILDRPVTITSGWRSEAHDAAVCKAAGKPVFKPNAHVNGHAADIACAGARERYFLIKAAMEAGINRIGGDAYHIHLDDDPALPPNVFFFE
jgi:uncharacterized protein YcbK (DUF882 family)